MTKSLLEKLYLKPEYRYIVIHVPEEIRSAFQNSAFSDSLKGIYNFILLFSISKSVLEKEAPSFYKYLADDGLLWIAYPKGKALKTNLNRDILHDLMKKYCFDGVSIISLNDTWSAMRFKKI